MKTAFRMLLSTLATAAILYLLRYTYTFFIAQSTLGATVDTIVVWCLAALAILCVLLYLRCWLSLAFSGLRRLRQAKKAPAPAQQPAAAPEAAVQLKILSDSDDHRGFFAETAEKL